MFFFCGAKLIIVGFARRHRSAKKKRAPNTLFLFDEPARGLHQKDIQHLLDLIRGLTEAGHTVIAIEHAQDFVNAADYAVELSR